MDELHLEFLEQLQQAVGKALRDHVDADYFRRTAEMWKEKYDTLLNESIKTSEATAFGMLSLALKDIPR